MDDLIACVCDALEAAERPVCICGKTVGTPVIGLGQCCDCSSADDPDAGGQASIHFERMYPAEKTANGIQQVERLENCKPGGTAADLQITVTRCYPRLDEQGNPPTLDETSPYADDLNADMTTVWKALRCCGQDIMFRESAVRTDPDGGCYAFGVLVAAMVAL